MTQLSRPGGPGIRLDSGVYLGWTVPLDYDPLLAKLAVWALTREEAIARMLRALDEYTVDGIKTTLGFYRQIFADQAFRQGCLHTGFIGEFLGRSGTGLWPVDPDLETAAALVAAIHSLNHKEATQAPSVTRSRWSAEGREGLLR